MLTEVFEKVGGLSLMSSKRIVAVAVLNKPVGAPFMSLTSSVIKCLSFTCIKGVEKGLFIHVYM